MSAATPADALHRASTTAMSSVIETPAVLAVVMEVSWNTRKSWTSKSWTSWGSADAMSLTCRVTSFGSATSPYIEMNATSVGTKARNA